MSSEFLFCRNPTAQEQEVIVTHFQEACFSCLFRRKRQANSFWVLKQIALKINHLTEVSNVSLSPPVEMHSSVEQAVPDTIGAVRWLMRWLKECRTWQICWDLLGSLMLLLLWGPLCYSFVHLNNKRKWKRVILDYFCYRERGLSFKLLLGQLELVALSGRDSFHPEMSKLRTDFNQLNIRMDLSNREVSLSRFFFF